jgi:2-amino-4-hydroxy-6-hydroxymethyldihydropteridine diphosphokinase
VGKLAKSTGIYIGIGSNIDPESNILVGLNALAQFVTITGLSTFYQSESLGNPDHPPFINGVCAIETDLTPGPLKFDVLRVVEASVGRVRSDDKNAPRPLDLDILMYHDLCTNEAGLQIPDSDIVDRPFIYVPLLELCPSLILPGMNRPLSEMVDTSGGDFEMSASEEFSLNARRSI